MPTSGPPPRPPRRRAGLRILLGCVIVLFCGAGVGATFVLEQVHTLQAALAQNPSLAIASGVLAPSGYGSPETLLLVGNDQRNHTTTTPVLPHSNEMLLVRIDPGKPYISMMSIPRELEVTIYPQNQAPITTRLNYAYTAGGIPLLVSTIKQVTGLLVNHVVVVDFNQFKQAVNELGCVYSTIDRRYFHVNVPGGEQYQEINLQPGYQNLCGTQALQFVSYRHTDTSLVRDARDQSFLLDVKKQYGPTLIDNIGKFEQIFGRTVQTDPGLRSTSGLLNLIGTLIDSSSLRVRQVPFQANLVPAGATPCECVTASAQQIAASVHAFLHGGSPLPKPSTAAVAHALRNRQAVAHLPLLASGATELAQARHAARGMPFPYEYPRVQDRGGSGVPVFLRDYLIHAPERSAFPIYAAVFSAGHLGQYYDVQGTTWATAPLLDSPEQTIDVSGRTYDLYYSGQHLEMVAWYEHGAAYWIRNSLTDAVSNGELLAIAKQTRPVTAVGATSGRDGRTPVRLDTTPIPARASAAPQADLRQTLGSLAGLLALLAVPLLAIALIRRRRELAELRAGLRAHSLREAQLSAALAGAAIAPSAPSPSGYSAVNVYASGPSRLRGRVLAGLVVAAVAAAGALTVLPSTEGRNAQTVSAARHATRATARKAPDIPAVPVAVLNATSTPGAASRVAQQLRSYGVGIAAVGNLAESRPPGVWILYTPGQRSQAARLARILSEQAPTIVPIDPVAQAAAGSAARVVVVVT
jgi:polyisoprenyl-teichoic acid--peptidoglycan teichoic acid transferase